MNRHAYRHMHKCFGKQPVVLVFSHQFCLFSTIELIYYKHVGNTMILKLALFAALFHSLYNLSFPPLLSLSLSLSPLFQPSSLSLSLATFSLSSLSLSSLSFLPSKVITNRLRSRLILPSGRTGITRKLWLTKVGRDSMNSSTYEYCICRLDFFMLLLHCFLLRQIDF